MKTIKIAVAVAIAAMTLTGCVASSDDCGCSESTTAATTQTTMT